MATPSQHLYVPSLRAFLLRYNVQLPCAYFLFVGFTHPYACAHVKLLGPCYKTGRSVPCPTFSGYLNHALIIARLRLAKPHIQAFVSRDFGTPSTSPVNPSPAHIVCFVFVRAHSSVRRALFFHSASMDSVFCCIPHGVTLKVDIPVLLVVFQALIIYSPN